MEKPEDYTVKIQQATNGVILYGEEEPKSYNVCVFTSFENLARHLRSIFKMPTTATLPDEPHNVGCGAMQ